MSEPLDRFNDLNKQGFMRNVYRKPKKPKVQKPIEIIACDKCHDWHVKGKHIKREA